MKRLLLPEPLRQSLVRYALQEAPREACGILAGTGSRVKRVIPVPNMAETPETHFLLSPSVFVEVLRQLQQDGLDMIGFFHSHPHGDSIPSSTDIRDAAYPDAVTVIVGLGAGEAYLAAWILRPGDVLPVELVQVEDSWTDESLAPSQRVSVVVSALIALLLMVTIAITLLPPAPVIP